mgnify:CR=1 FL=1
MSAGVVKAIECISDLKDLAVDGIALAKAATRGALGWGAVFAGVVKVGADIKELAADAPSALPELADGISEAEAAQLGAASYVCVKAIVAALAA